VQSTSLPHNNKPKVKSSEEEPPTEPHIDYSLQHGVQAQDTVSSSGCSPVVSHRIKLKRNRELDPVRMLVLTLFIELTKHSFHQTRRQAQSDLELKTERNAMSGPQLRENRVNKKVNVHRDEWFAVTWESSTIVACPLGDLACWEPSCSFSQDCPSTSLIDP
jgi:hypothetical protein